MAKHKLDSTPGADYTAEITFLRGGLDALQKRLDQLEATRAADASDTVTELCARVEKCEADIRTLRGE